MTFAELLCLSWTFIRIKLLTTSGPASVRLLYEEAVGRIMTRAEFVEAVGLSAVLEGSDALQLAMFVGYGTGGVPGALAALLGSILPPTVLMLRAIAILQGLRGEAWVGHFVQGLAPAGAVLMVLVVWHVFRGDANAQLQISIGIAAASLVALLFKLASPLVLLAASLACVVLL